MSTPSIQMDTARRLFEISVDGHVAHLEYREKQGVLTILHTLVPSALGGRGYGAALVDAAVAHALQAGLRVASECGYATRRLAANEARATAGKTGH
ncbi:GNAT family N-acetyltransferase [Luteimonas sp. 3794]|uniref:GNAT family N-acetyltransferase n=1 Tax=Luteimonas sp. 3794 TaxID=2817730 RepID=UPI002859D323|nr:GNAT family N-acetyltransferase [Luteimonas sp. 3794]MDR6992576.1 putative GNAT family acetyltransferase [Luteimonas sp. 3794]